jgi:alpha-beta hydrolase superfamily lysophospholipase
MSSRSCTIVVWLAGFGAACYGTMAAAAFFGQRWLIYPAPGNPVEPRARGAELVHITAADGLAFFALYAPAQAGAPTVVHFHGNGEDLAGQALLIEGFRRAGLGVYAVEYPGYGLAAGAKLDESSIYATAEASLRHLIALGVPRESIVVQGQSLGSGVAIEMARRGYGARLVLISPYTSMVDMAALVAPYLPVRWLVRDRYESERKAPAIALPALVIHGTEDEVVPFRMGRRIADLLPHCEFVPVSGAGHNDLFDQRAVDVLARIAAFASKL